MILLERERQRMVRAPCCDKLGMNRGPWTQEEDDILVGHIRRNGHGNWRALPKQSGLLRCGKSCRLRWTNYLRPDIKRGNFSMEEEDAIINLHQMLGNRWSVIAAKLPGRTDNEIKNVWHTRLKKRALPIQAPQISKRESQCETEREISGQPTFEALSLSSEQSYNDISCSGTDSSVTTRDNYIAGLKEVIMDSSEEFVEIEDSFWSEELSKDNSLVPPTDLETLAWPLPDPVSDTMICSFGSSEDDMSFWLRIFLGAGNLQDLPKLFNRS